MWKPEKSGTNMRMITKQIIDEFIAGGEKISQQMMYRILDKGVERMF